MDMSNATAATKSPATVSTFGVLPSSPKHVTLAKARAERKAALANADRVRAMVAKASAGGNVALSPALAAKVRAAVSRRDAAVAAYNAAIMAM